MARKINTEKVKKKGKKKKIFIILLFIIVVAVLSVFLYKRFTAGGRGPQTVAKVLSSIDEYQYTLTDKDSDYYKKEYKELEKILGGDVDEKEYATQVAKLFVIDLYTLSTKINKYDIGGYEFYYNEKVEMYEQKVMDTLYSQMEDDTYGDRKQDLPKVKNVEIVSAEEAEYTMGEEKVAAYQVKVKITYEKDMGYDDEATLMICKEKGIRWSVVDIQPTLNPKYDTNKEKKK